MWTVSDSVKKWIKIRQKIINYLKVAQATPKDRQIWLKKGGLSKAE